VTESEPGGDSSSQLCTSCGLCCSGILYDWVPVLDSEKERVERLGFDIEEHEPAARFNLPCPRLNGCHCTIYPERPSCCRTFHCKLLKGVEAGEVEPSEAMAVVVEAKSMIDELRPMLKADVRTNLGRHWAKLFDDWRNGPPEGRTDASKSQLILRLTALNRLLDRHFRLNDQPWMTEE